MITLRNGVNNVPCNLLLYSNSFLYSTFKTMINLIDGGAKSELKGTVVVVNHCFTSLFGTKGLLSDIVIR